MKRSTSRLAEISGANVHYLNGRDWGEKSTSETWVRDQYISIGDTILVPSLLTSRHQKSVELMNDYLQKHGIETLSIDYPLQGGDVIVDQTLERFIYAVEVGRENAFEGIDKIISEATGFEPVRIIRNNHPIERPPINLSNHWEYQDRSQSVQADDFYHLDTFMAQLPNGKFLVFADAMEDDSYDRLTALYGADHFIEIPQEDAINFATNVFFLGDIMMTPYVSDELRSVLEQEGLTVIEDQQLGKDISWELHNGGIHCLMNTLPYELGQPQ